MASCETCFYAERGHLEDPCSTCDHSGMGENPSNWVSMKVFDKVDNKPWEQVVADLSETPKQGVKYDDGKAICAIIAGSYYQHDESYMDKLSNRHWRGLVVLNEVEDGCFDEMMLSIEYLEKKYGKL